MRVSSKGQVTIPVDVREKLGILPHSEVTFEVHGSSARLTKVPPKRAGGRGARVVARLKGQADVKMTTNEILALTRKPILPDQP